MHAPAQGNRRLGRTTAAIKWQNRLTRIIDQFEASHSAPSPEEVNTIQATGAEV